MRKTIYDPMNYIAIKLLEDIGIQSPEQAMIDKMELAISHTLIKQHLFFEPILNEEEVACLFWAAKGKTVAQTAEVLSLSIACIKQHRKNILAKLEVENMTQAVFQGIKFAWIRNESQMNKD